MQLSESIYGKTPEGQAVRQFTLSNNQGITVKLISFGALITELQTPDRNGKPDEITLGFDRLEDYLVNFPHFGCTVGRVANRINGGTFTLNGKTCRIPQNDHGRHSLHGGRKGFHKFVWDAAGRQQADSVEVEFSRVSPDGEEGFPGNLSVKTTYSLNRQNELAIRYTATTDQPTPVNLTNHAYFNLAGKGDILGHQLLIEADQYTPVNADLIPTGELAGVAGTPLDFTHSHAIGEKISLIPGTPGGYDNNYVIRRQGPGRVRAARVHEPVSGRVMEIFATQPGIQFYSGNFLDGTIAGRKGLAYQKHAGFCLETQHFPDSVNQPRFPSIILQPGQTYRHETVHRFPVAG
ncbi:MAG: galactose mutarotase [Verrucomicrobiae bacterium]|nr:galactose mutarotase [Verrucomicrobiae bacterium]